MKNQILLLFFLLAAVGCSHEPSNPDAPWADYEPPKESPLSDPFRVYEEDLPETEPTQGEGATETEEEPESFFNPTEKIPADVSVDFPVDI